MTLARTSRHRELHRFGRRVEAVRLGLFDPHAYLRDPLEPLEDGPRDVRRDAFKEHSGPAGDLVPYAGRELGDVEGRRELVAGDRVREVDRSSDVDQIVVRIPLIDRRGSLPATAAQPANEDASREHGHDPVGRGAPGSRCGIEVAPYPAHG